MVQRLFVQEVRQMVLRWPSLILAGFVVALGVYALTASRGEPTRLIGFWGVERPYLLNLLIPIIASTVGAGSLARDYCSGYTQLVLARGFSRRSYLLVKSAAVATATGLILLGGYLFFYFIGIWFLPIGISTPPENSESVTPFVGPIRELFIAQPVLNDLLGIVMSVMAVAGLSLFGILTGVILRNEYLASIAPFALCVIGLYALRGVPLLNPFTYIDVWGSYKEQFPNGIASYSALLYWTAFGLLMVELASIIFDKKDLN